MRSYKLPLLSVVKLICIHFYSTYCICSGRPRYFFHFYTSHNIFPAGKGEIEFSTFKKFVDRQSLIRDLEEDPTVKMAGDQLEEYLKSSYNKADANNLAKYLRDRWKTFASFRREGAKGDVSICVKYVPLLY